MKHLKEFQGNPRDFGGGGEADKRLREVKAMFDKTKVLRVQLEAVKTSFFGVKIKFVADSINGDDTRDIRQGAKEIGGVAHFNTITETRLYGHIFFTPTKNESTSPMNFNNLKAMLDEARITDLAPKYAKVLGEIKSGITNNLEDNQMGDVTFHDPQAMKSKKSIHCMWSIDLSTEEREHYMSIDTEQFNESEICTAIADAMGKHLDEDSSEAAPFDHDEHSMTKDNAFKFMKTFHTKEFETADGDKVDVRIEVLMMKSSGDVYHENYPAFEIKVISDVAES